MMNLNDLNFHDSPIRKIEASPKEISIKTFHWAASIDTPAGLSSILVPITIKFSHITQYEFILPNSGKSLWVDIPESEWDIVTRELMMQIRRYYNDETRMPKRCVFHHSVSPLNFLTSKNVNSLAYTPRNIDEIYHDKHISIFSFYDGSGIEIESEYVTIGTDNSPTVVRKPYTLKSHTS